MKQKILTVAAAVLAIAIIAITAGSKLLDQTPGCVELLEKGLNRQDISIVQQACLPSEGDMAAASAGLLFAEMNAASSNPSVKILMAGDVKEIDPEHKEFMAMVVIGNSSTGKTEEVLSVQMTMASEDGKWYLKMS